MTTLRDRLDDLAGDAPAPPSAYAGELWTRGKRRHRRKVAGIATTVVLTVALVTGIGLSGWQQSTKPGFVADPDAALALPSRLHEPSPWLPGTAASGPMGPLAAVIEARRNHWFGSELGVVGVSAATGEYRFLDLPDGVPDTPVSLSADGTRLAYWTGGTPSGSPNPAYGPVTGLAVHDTVTGKTIRHSIETEHGLSVVHGILQWLGPQRVVAGYGQWLAGKGDDETAQGTSRGAPLLVWDVEQDRTTEPAVPTWDVLSVVGDGVVLTTGDKGHRQLVDLDTQRVLERFTPDEDLWGEPLPSPQGRRVVGVTGGPREGVAENPNRMVVGAIGGGGRVRMRLVPNSSETFGPVAWLNEEQVAVTRRAGHDEGDAYTVDLVLVDVATGQSNVVVKNVGGLRGDAARQQLAVDLLAVPSVDRHKPPRPWDPRAVVGLGGAAAVVAGLAALLLWRRRARA